MPPFKYEAFVNPYIGSISELMGKGDQAKAEALLRIGEIQARAAEQRGQAWGNAIQGLGNIASKAITDYNDPKLKMEKMALAQAEEDRKNEVLLGKLMKRTEASTSTRVVDGVPVISKVDPRDMVSRQTSTLTPELFSRVQSPELSSRVPSASFGEPFDVSDGGMARVGSTSPSLVSTTTSRGAYEDEYGFFNYKKAHQDLINSGASPASAARVLESGQKTNTALSTYAAQTKAFAVAKTDMFGNAANTILNALDASPTLKVQDAIQQMLPMLRSKLPEAEYASLQQQILGMPEAEARQALTGLVDAMDAQNPKTEVSGTNRLVSKSGRTFLDAVPVARPTQEASFGIKTEKGKVINVKGAFDPVTGFYFYEGRRIVNPVLSVTDVPSSNSAQMFQVDGEGYVPLTEEKGKPGEPTRYFLETPTGRIEKFAGKDFKGRPQASVVLNAGINTALENIPEWAMTANRPESVPESNKIDKNIGLSPNSLYQGAVTFIDSGAFPPTGRGNTALSVAARSAIQAKVGAIASEAGMDVPEFRAVYAANRDALKKLTSSQSTVSAYIATADKNADQLLAILDKIPDSNVTLLNSAARSAQQKLGGNVDMAEFNTYLKSVSNEYARIISQPNLTGVLTNDARREAALLLPSNASVGQIRASLRALKSEGQNRVTSISDAVKSLQSSMTRNPRITPSSEPVVPASMGNAGRITVTLDSNGNLVRTK